MCCFRHGNFSSSDAWPWLSQSWFCFFFFFLTKRSHGCASQGDCLAGNLTLVLQLLKHHLNLSPQCPPNAHCRIQGLLFIETGTVSLCFPRLPESFLANDKLFSCSFQCRNCHLQLSKFLYLLEIEFHLFWRMSSRLLKEILGLPS